MHSRFGPFKKPEALAAHTSGVLTPTDVVPGPAPWIARRGPCGLPLSFAVYLTCTQSLETLHVYDFILYDFSTIHSQLLARVKLHIKCSKSQLTAIYIYN
jgi:hypothetical protein